MTPVQGPAHRVLVKIWLFGKTLVNERTGVRGRLHLNPLRNTLTRFANVDS